MYFFFCSLYFPWITSTHTYLPALTFFFPGKKKSWSWKELISKHSTQVVETSQASVRLLTIHGMLIDYVTLWKGEFMFSYRKVGNLSSKRCVLLRCFTLVCFLEKITVIWQWEAFSTTGNVLHWIKWWLLALISNQQLWCFIQLRADSTFTITLILLRIFLDTFWEFTL